MQRNVTRGRLEALRCSVQPPRLHSTQCDMDVVAGQPETTHSPTSRPEAKPHDETGTAQLLETHHGSQSRAPHMCEPSDHESDKGGEKAPSDPITSPSHQGRASPNVLADAAAQMGLRLTRANRTSIIAACGLALERAPQEPLHAVVQDVKSAKLQSEHSGTTETLPVAPIALRRPRRATTLQSSRESSPQLTRGASQGQASRTGHRSSPRFQPDSPSNGNGNGDGDEEPHTKAPKRARKSTLKESDVLPFDYGAVLDNKWQLGNYIEITMGDEASTVLRKGVIADYRSGVLDCHCVCVQTCLPQSPR